MAAERDASPDDERRVSALELRGVISIIAEGNDRSVRVAEKLGMSRGPDRLHPARRRLRVYAISAHDAASSPRPS